MAGNGGQGMTTNGGDGGDSAGIYLSSPYLSSVSHNTMSGIVGGNGADAVITFVFLGGKGGNSCGISVGESKCVEIENSNVIAGIVAGYGGASFLSSPKNGKAASYCLPPLACINYCIYFCFFKCIKMLFFRSDQRAESQSTK